MCLKHTLPVLVRRVKVVETLYQLDSEEVDIMACLSGLPPEQRTNRLLGCCCKELLISGK